MSSSRLPQLIMFAFCLVTAASYAQSQASCTFASFGLGVNIPNLGSGFISPAGINDWGTIVGTAIPNNDQITPNSVGLIRWAHGGVSFPLGTANASGLTDRNDKGVSVGEIGGIPILLNGGTFTDITLNNFSGQLQSANGINNWGSIVGTYFMDFPNGLTGFKRWNNGGFFTLSFPGSLLTTPTSSNDNGIIVGYYFPTFGSLPNGFIYHSGQWATLKFPHSMNTVLVGIDNAGVIIGNALMPDKTSKPFLYENGAFKVISVPGATTNSTTLFGISPKLGLIVGTAGGVPKGGFIAKCQ